MLAAAPDASRSPFAFRCWSPPSRWRSLGPHSCRPAWPPPPGDRDVGTTSNIAPPKNSASGSTWRCCKPVDQAMCDYAEDALVVLPNQIVSGLDNIRGGLSGVGALLGGAVPQIQTLTATSDVVLITFTAFGTPVPSDGSDTYIVEKGHIVTQTVHDTFKSTPGFTCPVAAPGT